MEGRKKTRDGKRRGGVYDERDGYHDKVLGCSTALGQ
jgi:hypothetical protein